MNSKTVFFVANWKSYMTCEQSICFVTENFDGLVQLADDSRNEIVLCPSFANLSVVGEKLRVSNIKLGAQDCSSFGLGAFTGQEPVGNLKAIGCTYCIIGHSERRQYNHETDCDIAQKFGSLVEHGISPIVCVGESRAEYNEKKALFVLERQLGEIFEKIKNGDVSIKNNMSICIAYEPIWSIGTGKIPDSESLETIFSWLYKKSQELDSSIDWKLLYGGSVTGKTVQFLKEIEHIMGFLIGKASTDFQELKKIVHYSG